MKNIKILQEKENPLFKRTEVELSLDSETTPSREDVKKIIAEKFSSNSENVSVKRIYGKFGYKIFKVSASVYASEKDKDETELKKKKDIKKEGKSGEK